MATTIRQLAQHAGLSRETVRRVLAGQDHAHSAETRLRVNQAVQTLGYRPNAAAKAISTGRFGAVGLLLSSAVQRSYLPHQLLTGIEDAIEQAGVRLMVGRLPDEQLEREGVVPSLLRDWSCDGLLVNIQEEIPPRLIELIEHGRTPSVWINTPQRSDCVYPDEFDAGLRATRHLLDLGHRHIAYLDYSHGRAEFATVHYSARERQAGYEAAMDQRGLPPRIIRSEQTLHAPAERVSCSRAWLSAPDRPSAVVAYSATNLTPMAVAALRLGIEIPRDLSVVTFDEHPIGPLGVMYTTLVSPLAQMGRSAAARLLGLVGASGESGPPQRLALPYTLFPGETAIPPGGT